MNDKRQGVLLEWMLDKIEKNGRVDGSSFFCVFECEVQVGLSKVLYYHKFKMIMSHKILLSKVTFDNISR